MNKISEFYNNDYDITKAINQPINTTRLIEYSDDESDEDIKYTFYDKPAENNIYLVEQKYKITKLKKH